MVDVPTREGPAYLHHRRQPASVRCHPFLNLRQERLNAGLAVANGLPYPAALAAITLTPARIWGMADQIGSLDVGKTADLVLWTGDPLETTTWADKVFVGGVEQPTDSRQSQLRDRYAGQDNGLPPAYR